MGLLQIGGDGPNACAAQKFRSFEVDRYNGQPANNRLTFVDALLPEREPPVIVGLATAAEMNLVQIGTNEFFQMAAPLVVILDAFAPDDIFGRHSRAVKLFIACLQPVVYNRR